jgi:phage N-6-adenine-methyltransferase
MVDKTLFASDRDDWETPDALFDALHEEFKFTIDIAASEENRKLVNYRSEGSLAEQWPGRVWCNPPYGRGVHHWMERAYLSTWHGDAEIVVMLLAARTDTKGWHQWVFPFADEIRFLQGRVKFKGAKNAAPFPSALVVWKHNIFEKDRSIRHKLYSVRVTTMKVPRDEE